MIEILENLVEIQPGYAAKGRIKESPTGSHHLLQTRDIETGTISWATPITFHPSHEPDRYILQHNDILFIARGYENKAYLVEDPPDYCLASNVFYIIRPNNIHPGYLTWWLNERIAQAYFAQYQVRKGFVYLSKKNLSKLEIPVLNHETQENIAELQSLMMYEQKLITKILQLKQKIISTVCLATTQKKEG